jgi:hypothetical protein
LIPQPDAREIGPAGGFMDVQQVWLVLRSLAKQKAEVMREWSREGNSADAPLNSLPFTGANVQDELPLIGTAQNNASRARCLFMHQVMYSNGNRGCSHNSMLAFKFLMPVAAAGAWTQRDRRQLGMVDWAPCCPYKQPIFAVSS